MNNFPEIIERHGLQAVFGLVRRSTVFLIPGAHGAAATCVGSGVTLATPQGHVVILTAKHLLADDFRDQPIRIGHEGCLDAISDALHGYLLGPDDVDVCLMIPRSHVDSVLRPSAAPIGCIANSFDDLEPSEPLYVAGFPWDVAILDALRKRQHFHALIYGTARLGAASSGAELLGLEWTQARSFWTSDEVALPRPPGISGGAVWHFTKRRIPDGGLWTPEAAGRIVGIPSSWNKKDRLTVEPVTRWSGWLLSKLADIEEACLSR